MVTEPFGERNDAPVTTRACDTWRVWAEWRVAAGSDAQREEFRRGESLGTIGMR